MAELATILGPILIGLAVSFLLLTTLVIPNLGFPGDLERIAKLNDRLAQIPSGARRTVIVSNSVGVEGIDASVIQDELGPDHIVENQSSNGLDILSARVYIGVLLSSHPDTLVWVLRPEVIGEISDINAEVASTMCYANMPRHNDWLQDANAAGLEQNTKERLFESWFFNLLALRTLPNRHLNEQIRVRTRRGVLRAKPLDMIAPYQMETTLSGTKLARHIDDISASFNQRTADNNRNGLVLIKQTIEQISAAQTAVVLVVAPTHPDAIALFGPANDMFRDALEGLAAETNATVIDLSRSLSSDQFADAIHPNRNGAAELSRQLGEKLRQHTREDDE